MRFIIVLVLSIFCQSVYTQTAGFLLSGVVFDSSAHVALPGAVVELLNPDRSAMTDQNGNFHFDQLPSGTYILHISYLGMETRDLTIEIEGKNKYIEIALIAKNHVLTEVVVSDKESKVTGIHRLRQVEDFAIYASKKNELIELNDLTINKASNQSRQIYAKVSGLNIWESDGAGVQLGIGGRGLSPNRNSNFNTRQNGYDISADALGYPESYYTPPAEAIERIEIVRGAASLQYGTQFGGMINFKFKEGVADQKVQLHSRQTVGSYGFLNSFNSLGGTVKKVKYYGFYQYKKSNGWRPNESLDQHSGYISAKFTIGNQLEIRPEFTHSHYLAQQPGGLTDAQFASDPRQSNRERNWFAVDWNLFALNMDYRIRPKLRLNNRTFGLLAGRDALGNLDNINLIDFGENRDFLSDRFRNWGNETRLLFQYNTGLVPSTFLIGSRYYQGFTSRKQGEGDNGSGPEFRYLHPNNLEGSDFDLPSSNFSLFAENVFSISEKWSITPGIRYEYISTAAEGYYRIINKDLAGNIIYDERIQESKLDNRSFVFFGLGSSYRPSEMLELYTNFSQNYRAINFNDIRVNVGSLRVDENLRDEKGFNFDLGCRGKWGKWLDFDVSFYHLSYNDRIGTILQKEPNPIFNNLVDRVIRYRTNIADAKIYGLESLLEFQISEWCQLNNDYGISLFTNLSMTHATYLSSEIPGQKGKYVEVVPPLIFKTGLFARWRSVSLNIQYAYIDQHFSDASNAIITPTAIEGIIPAYQIVDLSTRYTFAQFEIEAGVNNLLNASYFTRRATGYPGPGIIPSQGKSYYMTFGVKI